MTRIQLLKSSFRGMFARAFWKNPKIRKRDKIRFVVNIIINPNHHV